MRPKRVYIRCRFQSFQVSSWFPCWKLLVLGFFHVHFGDVKNSMVSTHDLPSKWRIFRPKQTPQIVSQLYPHVPVDNDIGYKMYIYIYACVFYQSIPIVLPKFHLQTTWIMIARLTNEQCLKQLTWVFEHCSNATWFQLSHQYPIPSHF